MPRRRSFTRSTVPASHFFLSCFKSLPPPPDNAPNPTQSSRARSLSTTMYYLLLLRTGSLLLALRFAPFPRHFFCTDHHHQTRPTSPSKLARVPSFISCRPRPPPPPPPPRPATGTWSPPAGPGPASTCVDVYGWVPDRRRWWSDRSGEPNVICGSGKKPPTRIDQTTNNTHTHTHTPKRTGARAVPCAWPPWPGTRAWGAASRRRPSRT